MIKRLSAGLLFGALLLSGCATEIAAPETTEQTADKSSETNQLIDELLDEHEENTNYASDSDKHIAYTQQELAKHIDGNLFVQDPLFNRDTYAYELRLSDNVKAKIEQNGFKVTYLSDLSAHARQLSAFVQETSYDPDLNIGVVDPNDDTRDYLFLIRDGEVIESIFDDMEIAD